MQVMQTSEFEKTEVLVGQVSETKNFGVSDDPMLMSMLSTGFYANPLRTMIQEIMFNAWDAHRMGDCLDRPIDVYINEGTGLIIRDYGPGIHDDDIHGVYCIYGASTKRHDKRQTGGFGLGSKSPFAYSESFTVTSMHSHVKCMYHISRVSEDGGKPGMTRLIKIDTTESGLMVTVPLEAKDRSQAAKYIRDVLFLSGIKANFHYMDDAPELIESLALKTGEYHIDTRTNGQQVQGIYAVYGGVRYAIPVHEDYANELMFLQQISKDTGLFIGFAPDTLTPVPNRESLNMSLKCRENVRIGLELCIERFKEVLTPLIHAFFRECFEATVANGIQSHFAIFNAATGREAPIHVGEFVTKYIPLVPLNVDISMWKVGLRMIHSYRPTLIKAFGQDRWMRIMVHQFCIAYPDNKSLGFAVSKMKDPKSRQQLNEVICNNMMPSFYKDLYDFEQELKAEFPDDDTLHATLRYQTGTGTFTKLSRVKTRVSRVSDKHKKSVSDFEDPYFLYNVKNLNKLNQVFLTKTVLLAKTIQVLNDSMGTSRVYEAFSNKPVSEFDYMCLDHDASFMMCCVVYNRKGAYQKAKEILESRGFNVVEANEPSKIVRAKVDGPPVKLVPTYPLLTFVGRSQWREYGETSEIEDPTHMLYILQSTIQDDAYYNRKCKPEYSLLSLVKTYYPKTVLIQNVIQAKLLEGNGVLTFKDAVQSVFEQLHTKKYRFRNIVRAMRLLKDSHIPEEMLKDPIIQRTMGMVAIESDDADAFWKELNLYKVLCDSNYMDVTTTVKAANALIQTTWNADPMREKVAKAIEASLFFGESALKTKWLGMKPEDRPDFAKRVSKFILGN